MTHNSKEAWRTIRKLTDDHKQQSIAPVTANAVAHQLLLNGKTKVTCAPKKSETKIPTNSEETTMTAPFSETELTTSLKELKAGKAAGLDDIQTEILQHLGPESKKWLLQLLNNCMRQRAIPSAWRKTKIAAIPKPGKDPNLPKSYRPIALLSHVYKLYERMLMKRI